MKTTTTLLALISTLPFLTTAWNDGYGDIASGYFSVHFTGQDPGTRQFQLHGENANTVTTIMNPCNEKDWVSTDSFLPYVVSCRGGANFCMNSATSYNDDWMAVKYANQLLNVETDSRCGHIDDSYFDHYRCIIPVRP
jgi:hypothetical protein